MVSNPKIEKDADATTKKPTMHQQSTKKCVPNTTICNDFEERNARKDGEGGGDITCVSTRVEGSD
jgi:hypothetical protein